MSESPRRLHVLPPSPDEGIPALLHELAHVLARLRELHHELAVSPDPGGPAEEVLLALQQRRDDLGRLLGADAVRLVAAGGTLTAVPPTPLPEA